MTGKRR